MLFYTDQTKDYTLDSSEVRVIFKFCPFIFSAYLIGQCNNFVTNLNIQSENRQLLLLGWLVTAALEVLYILKMQDGTTTQEGITLLFSRRIKVKYPDTLQFESHTNLRTVFYLLCLCKITHFVTCVCTKVKYTGLYSQKMTKLSTQLFSEAKLIINHTKMSRGNTGLCI